LQASGVNDAHLWDLTLFSLRACSYLCSRFADEIS
jgi:hypothetical protein